MKIALGVTGGVAAYKAAELVRRLQQEKLDVQGALQVKKMLPDAIAIFVLAPSREDIESRIRVRGQDSEDEIRRRLERARQEMLTYSKYDYAVINDDLDRAGGELRFALPRECGVFGRFAAPIARSRLLNRHVGPSSYCLCTV